MAEIQDENIEVTLELIKVEVMDIHYAANLFTKENLTHLSNSVIHDIHIQQNIISRLKKNILERNVRIHARDGGLFI